MPLLSLGNEGFELSEGLLAQSPLSLVTIARVGVPGADSRSAPEEPSRIASEYSGFGRIDLRLKRESMSLTKRVYRPSGRMEA